MSYKFNKEIIHDNDSMWDIACLFISHYEFIREQVERSEKDKPCSSIIYKGKVVMQLNERYKKILSDYKKELEFMNQFIYFKLKHKNNKLQKYVTV